MWEEDLRTILLLLFFMLLFAVVYSLTGCTKTAQKIVTTHDTVYVGHTMHDSTYTADSAHEKDFTSKTDTVYMVRVDTVHKTDVRHDSVLVRDSVYIRERGDSVYIYKEKWRERLVFARDTLYKSRTDTLRQIVHDTVYRERTDTLRVIRFVDRGDTSYISKSDREKVVKERRTFAWLKVLGVMVAVFGAIAVWLKFKRD